MKSKAMCVVDVKPKTNVLTFWVKNSDEFELDMNPETDERKPGFTGIPSPQGGGYMGKQ